MRGVFVAGTGTGVGKTVVACALARALAARGLRVAALKPIETGCADGPADARLLAEAAGADPSPADAPGLYRARAAVSPRAATLAGEPAPPPIAELAAATRAASGTAELVVVEGAGGVLVPVHAHTTIADLALELALPVLLVGRDELGVLSHTLAALESLGRRGLETLAVVLHRAPGAADAATATNSAILAERIRPPCVVFAPRALDPVSLRLAAGESGLVEAVLTATRR